MENTQIPDKENIWFGKLDVKSSKLELINGKTWNVVLTLGIDPYLPNIFLINGLDGVFLNLRASSDSNGQHTLAFVKDKYNPQRSVGSGYFVHELKSIEDCKKFLADWKAEAERTNCEKESCYGN